MHCGKPLEDDTKEFCMDCSRRSSCLEQGRALWLHKDPVPGAVYRYKYKNKRSYGAIFAEEMMSAYGEFMKRWGIGAILPIPLHSSKMRQRGYNQAELLARELSVRSGIPCRSDVLFRIRKTVPQKSLDARERRQNMQGAFAVSARWEPVSAVLLIDDIYTTGSTLERAALVLKKAGVQKVYFLTISIGQGV